GHRHRDPVPVGRRPGRLRRRPHRRGGVVGRPLPPRRRPPPPVGRRRPPDSRGGAHTMTTPDVPLRLELTCELPGTAEQVWAAVATGNGQSSWFLPTDLEERVGGTIVVHMGEEASSRGSVTGWEPPIRFEMAEPDWAALTGH